MGGRIENLKHFTSETGKLNQPKSVESRKRNAERNKAFKEIFNEILNEKGGVYEGEEITKKQAIVIKALQYMLDSSADINEGRTYLKAFEIVRDTIDEKPTDRHEIANLDEHTNNLKELLEQRNESRREV